MSFTNLTVFFLTKIAEIYLLKTKKRPKNLRRLQLTLFICQATAKSDSIFSLNSKGTFTI